MAISSRHQFKMIVWTLGVMLTLGLSLVYSMLEPPHIYRHQIAVAQRSHQKSDQGSGRFPASIGSRLTSVEDDLPTAKDSKHHVVSFPQLATEAYDLMLPCLTSKSETVIGAGSHTFVPSTAKQIRIRAVGCNKHEKFENIEISNSSNGFMATVFQPTSNSLLTDYIALAKSTSVVRVKFENEMGDIVTHDFIIDHAPASPSQL